METNAPYATETTGAITDAPTNATPLGWCLVELLGHRRLGAHVSEHQIAGATFLRLDVPETDGAPAYTTFVLPSSVYALSPTTQEIATAIAYQSSDAPINRYALRRLLEATPGTSPTPSERVGRDRLAHVADPRDPAYPYISEDDEEEEDDDEGLAEAIF